MTEPGARICGYCHGRDSWLPAMSAVVLFAPALAAPHVLIPTDDSEIHSCEHAVYAAIDKLQGLRATTRDAGLWTRAIIMFENGNGVDVKHRGRYAIEKPPSIPDRPN